MSSSSNSIIGRIKQQAAELKPQAQEEILSQLRTENAVLKATTETLRSQVSELTRRVDYMVVDFSALLDFITESGVELTDEMTNVVGRHEELRLLRILKQGVTGMVNPGQLYFRGLDD